MIWTFCGLPAAWAQVGLEVNVINKRTARPVRNIPVVVVNPSIAFYDTVATDLQGKARFSGLSTSGTYEVKVQENDDYHSITTGDLELRSNKTRSITLLLNSKQTVNLPEITVEAPVTKINTVDAEVAADLDAGEIRQLPVEGRDITKVLYRLPNVTRATGFFPEAPNVSINGGNSLYTNYLVDGMDNNENFLGGQKFPMPVGFTQNISVMTHNYSAEFGLSGNGVFNVTSKSGSNDFGGEVFYEARPGPVIDGSSPFAQRDLSGNPVKNGFQRHQAGFAIGGPIKKNKTFYFVDVEHTLDLKDNLLNVPPLGINETVRGTNKFTYLSGKLDQHWNNHWRSSLRINSGLVSIERQGGGLEGGVTFPSAANTQIRNSFIAAGKTVYRKPGFTSETNLQYSRFRWNYADPVHPNNSSVTVLGPSEQTIAVVGNPGYIFDELENTGEFKQKFTIYKEHHTIKAGLGWIRSNHTLTGGGNVNGNYLVKLDQQQVNNLRSKNPGKGLNVSDIPSNADVLNYSVELQPRSFGKTQNIYNAYIEDLFSVTSRLNLKFGLRYDYDNLSKGGAAHGDYNNLAPRFNFNYKLDERSSIRGGYGLFYDKIVYSVYSDALQQSTTSADFKKQLQLLKQNGKLPDKTDLDRVTFKGNLSASFSNVDYLKGPAPDQVQGDRADIFSNELRILNPNGYDNPYTHQVSVGYQHQFGRDKLFYVDLMYSHSGNLFRLRDVNAPAPYPIDPNHVEVRSVTEADATRPVPITTDHTGSYSVVGSDTLRGIGRNVIMTEDKGQANYYAISFNLRKDRDDDNFSYRIIYTLAKLRNNTEDINFRAQDANNFRAEWGPSVNDRTHVINGMFTYYPTSRLTINMDALLQSGQPINRIPDATKYGTADLNGDGRSFADAYVGNSDRAPGESRNNDRLPWSDTFDLSASYAIPMNNKAHLEINADVFNVFNVHNMSGYANNATQSNQIQVGPKSSGLIRQKNAGPPRQFQFSIRYVF